MGLKGATFYFQRVITTVVLGEYIWHTCELYVDDLMIYGTTQEEFITNVRNVFQKLREFNIICKPTKTIIGASSIQYVGRTIDHEGISFHEKDLKKVLDFREVTTHADMKQFIGLVTYFCNII